VSDDIAIRPFATQADYEACVALQHETWGRDFKDAVPASILQVNQKIGGVSAGAFNGKGKLLGFVFGMTGVEDGRIVQWSDMLAVRPEARGKDSAGGSRNSSARKSRAWAGR
jgi:predicted GNAT superfamily acetyltransferase